MTITKLIATAFQLFCLLMMMGCVKLIRYDDKTQQQIAGHLGDIIIFATLIIAVQLV